MMPPRKPKLPPAVVAELEFFGALELRKKWHERRQPLLLLRHTTITTEDLMAWIRWLEWRETRRAWIMNGMTFAAMTAAIIAAVGGWIALRSGR